MDQIKVAGVGLGSHEEIELPRRTVPAAALRIGMVVDVPGTVFPRGKAGESRYTTRVTGWVRDDEGFVRSIQIRGWFRLEAAGAFGIRELPVPAGREIEINPLSKVWGVAF